MISDEYTREYDERQRKLEAQRRKNSVYTTAKRFGCKAKFKYHEEGVIIKIVLPNGAILTQFNSLPDAIAWAEKWK